MPGWIAHLPYPTTLAAGVLAVAAGLAAGLDPALAAGAAALGAMGLVALWERALPWTPHRRPSWGTVGIDAAHALVTALAVVPGVRVAFTVFVGALLASRVDAAGLALWPSGLPLAAQVVLAIVVADLGAYAGHRLMHATDAGWRAHAVHHTTRDMYVLAASRTHPFNAVITYTAETAPLVLLGIGPEALAFWTVIKATNGMLQHADVAYAPGPWAWFFATPEVHRWHHSVVLAESNTNFGNTTTLWDRAFGTLHLPGRPPGTDLGIAVADVPESYWAHLVTPFALGRFHREDA